MKVFEQRCAIHGDTIAGITYFCPSCHRWFCEDTVHFYILDVKACPACGLVIDTSSAPAFTGSTA
jgi:hypothetical protein